MKYMLHLVTFVVGASLGIWWGVNHPSQATTVLNDESAAAGKVETAVAKAKIELLQKFINSPTSQPADYNQMLDEEKQKLQAAQQSTTKG